MLGSLAALACGLAGGTLVAWTATTIGWKRLLRSSDAQPEGTQPQLVLRGPYAHVRHPILLASLLWLATLALVARGFGSTLVMALAAAWLIRRSRRRDRELSAHFGEAYQRYQRSVPFLLPRLKPRRQEDEC